VLTGPKKSRDPKKREGARKAKAAAGRVEKRLTGPSSKDLTKPGKKGSMGLLDILKGVIGYPSKLKKGAEAVEKKSRGGK